MVIKVLATEMYFIKGWERPDCREILENVNIKKITHFIVLKLYACIG
jgi:hypothetical protein